jgi:hypothetical protein
MRTHRLTLGALALLALGSLSTTVTVSRSVAAAPEAVSTGDTQPVRLSCITLPSSKPMVTVGNAETQWWLTQTPTPNPLPAFFYGGITQKGCPNAWIGDFKVTHATKVHNSVLPVYVIGGRSGKFDPYHAFSFSELCDSTTDTNCSTQVAERNCRRVVVQSTFAWKKHGWSDFKIYASTTQGFGLNNIICEPNGYLTFPLTPTNYDYNAPGKNGKTVGQHDGFLEVPAAGEEDVYRIAVDAFYVKYPIADSWNGKPNAKVLPIVDPAHNAASDNPITEQLPVQIGIRAN